MPFPHATISNMFHASDNAVVAGDRGRILEDIACELFEAVPGIERTRRNVVNAFDAEEIDVGFFNYQHRNGFPFLPHVLFVECKNQAQPVGNQDVTVFRTRLYDRRLECGILIASNGITGNPAELTAANLAIAQALGDGIKIIVLTRREIELLHSLKSFKTLMVDKILLLSLTQTSIAV